VLNVRPIKMKKIHPNAAEEEDVWEGPSSVGQKSPNPIVTFRQKYWIKG
jgi:hypothetical protein